MSEAATSPNVITITGRARKFKIPPVSKGETGTERTYAQLEIPLRDYHKIARAYHLKEGGKGEKRGEQRGEKPTQIRNLRRAMLNGNYSVAQHTLGTYTCHKKALTIDPETLEFELPVDTSKPHQLLPIIDSQQRTCSILDIRESISNLLEDAEDSEKDALQAKLDTLDELPVPVMLYLDGKTGVDFLNLNAGAPVDKTHMMMLGIDKAADDVRLASEICLELNASNTFFRGRIRFADATPVKNATSVKVALASLCQKGSDLSSSAVGLARVGLAAGMEAKELAEYVARAVKLLRDDEEFKGDDEYKSLTEEGRVLCPDGPAGVWTLYIGLATLLAYYGARREITREVEETFIGTALDELNANIAGDLGGARKRRLMGAAARQFLKDLDGPKVDGVPYELLSIMGSSACYDVDKEKFKAATKAEEKKAGA